jgi:hypothetical protein
VEAELKIYQRADGLTGVDVGYKKFLRSARKSLKQWFNQWCPI